MRKQRLARSLPSIHVATNPLRRGPIVLATDGASTSGASVVAAQLIASRLGLPVEVVTVLDRLPTFSSGPDLIIPLDPDIDDARRAARETTVSDYVCRFAGGAAPPRVHVRFGNVAAEVARFAREISATIIVMGSAPHRRFGHVVSGLRATQVLQTAACPVLSVPPTFTALPRSIIAAVDFGPSSNAAVQAALLVAGDGTTVFLTHVLAKPVRFPALRIVAETGHLINTHALFDILLEDLDASIPDGVNIERRIIKDDTIDGILSAADMDGALIAIGTHGPGAIARFFVGSVTEAILHSAEQPVLASPSPRYLGATPQPDDDPPEPKHQWAAALDAFSERNAGRFATLEIRDPALGPYVTGHGYTFLGATFEPGTRRVTVMVGDAVQSTQHLTRSIPHPDEITIRPSTGGDAEILDIRHGQGHTIVTVSAEP